MSGRQGRLSAAGVIFIVAGLLSILVADDWPGASVYQVLLIGGGLAMTQLASLSGMARRDDVVPPPVPPSLLADDAADALKHTIAALGAERDRFETVLEGMNEGVLATDSELRITVANPVARSLLGLPAEPIGLALAEGVQLPRIHRLVARGVSGPASIELDIAPNRVVDARARPLVSGGVVLTMLDVSEIRRLEVVRRDFVTNVSHELRTPVSVIRANADTLLAGALDDREAAQTFAKAMSRNAERLGRLVSDLLDLSRIEAGRYRIDSVRVSVRAAAEQAIEAIEANPTSIAIEVADGIDVTADQTALDQVLVNLIDNAVKHTGADSRVVVRARAVSEMVRIEVQDDGPGLADKERARVFERFYRVDPGRSRAAGGTGLGLSITKHLVEAMDGTVGVDSVLPHGSVFWFELPAPSSERPESDRPERDAS